MEENIDLKSPEDSIFSDTSIRDSPFSDIMASTTRWNTKKGDWSKECETEKEKNSLPLYDWDMVEIGTEPEVYWKKKDETEEWLEIWLRPFSDWNWTSNLPKKEETGTAYEVTVFAGKVLRLPKIIGDVMGKTRINDWPSQFGMKVLDGRKNLPKWLLVKEDAGIVTGRSIGIVTGKATWDSTKTAEALIPW